MKEYNVFFSPTGGTAKVSGMLCPEGIRIDLSERGYDRRTEFGEDDLVFITVPSFAGRVPAFTAERMRRCLRGNGALAVIGVCYGQRAFDDTLTELLDTAEELGFRVVAATADIAEHSMWREFAAGRPDGDDRKELTAFREKILEKIASGDMSVPEVPGNRPYKDIKPGMVPVWDGKLCTSCGLCASSCPASAIDMMSYGRTDSTLCMSCMRCCSICPTHARHMDEDRVRALADRIGPVCRVHKDNELYL